MKQTVVAILLVSTLAPAAVRHWMAGGTAAREGPARLSAGGNHACTALYDGTVRCWGGNSQGQLGNNNSALFSSAAPVTVLTPAIALPTIRTFKPLASVISVVSGTEFSCALTSSGRVFCWGRNDFGQLGSGAVSAPRPFAGPIDVIDDVVRIAAGANHACALRSFGDVWCWGQNTLGQLANGNPVPSPTPRQVNNIFEAVDIAAGANHTCAIVLGGSGFCWGNNSSGQLGDGTTVNRTAPVPVLNLSGAHSVTAGFAHTCAVEISGLAKCWGDNSAGQLGTGNNQPQPAPVAVQQLTGAVSVDAGSSHTCALTAAGLVRCWGSNNKGQVGDNSTVNRNLPTPVPGVTLAIAVSGGTDFSCATKADGTVSCWGSGSQGRNGSNADSPVPVPVSDIAGGISAKAVSAGDSHVCAVRGNGTVSCWGSNLNGLLGGNGSLSAVIPNPTAVNGLTGVTAVAAGGDHTCALIADGTVKCWGFNARGQVGNADIVDQPTPVSVGGGLVNAVAIQAGQSHTCALVAGGSVFCWGANNLGQLAINSDTADRRLPNLVAGVTTAFSLGVGRNHATIATAGADVLSWGSGAFGQMANLGTQAINTVPQAAISSSGLPFRAAYAAAGGDHSCAVSTSASTFCWGLNSKGQIGNNTAGGNVLLPAFVFGAAKLQASGGAQFTCAIANDGRVVCFGANDTGQLGIGTTDALAHPQAINFILGGGTQVAAGHNGFACAVTGTGALFCWGNNASGQIGIGTSGDVRPSPTAVPSFTFNIVPTVLQSPANPRKLTVNIVANCEEGDQLKLRVQVRQASGAAGHGNETTRCTGAMATFPVEIQAQGGTPFAPGAATVEADAEIRGDRGGERTTQQWTRAANIVN